MKSVSKFSLRWKHGLLVLGLGAGFGLANWSPDVRLSAQDAQQTAQTAAGVHGIFPTSVPAGLSADDFAGLGPAWAEWTKGASETVARLYEDEKLDVAGQRAVLEILKVKLGTMEKALSDPSYRSIFDSLSQQQGRLARRVAVANGVLDTLELTPATAHAARIKMAQIEAGKAANEVDDYLKSLDNSQAWAEFVKVGEVGKLTSGSVAAEVLQTVNSRLVDTDKLEGEVQRSFLKRAAFVKMQEKLDAYLKLANAPVPQTNLPAMRASMGKLVEALEQYEDGRSSTSAKAARDAFADVRKLAADGGDRLGESLSAAYFNFNFRIIATEPFLTKLAQRSRTDSGAVDDFILGAKVDGQQTTNTTVGIDVQPNAKNIQFALTLSGVAQTSTQGVTEQATIFTSGYHQFWAKKSIAFNGDKFLSWPATINVQANNTTTGARTGASGVPIFGGIVDNYAVGKARERRYESEQIASGKLQAQVLPRFDSEVDGEFFTFSKKLEESVIPSLKKNRLYPSARSFMSSDSEIYVSTRLMEDGELAADSTRLTAMSATGAAVHLHETMLNNSFDRMNLGGRSLTEGELAKEISKALSDALGRDIQFGTNKSADDKPDTTKFVLPTTDFIRMRIENGTITLVIRMGLEPEGREAIPTQEISVPIKVTIEGNSLKLEAGEVTVSPVDAVANAVEQRARAAVVTTKIQKALPVRTVDRFIDVKRDDGSTVKVAIVGVKANGGWLSIVFE